MVVPIEDTGAKHAAVPVARIVHRLGVGQVVDVVQLRALGDVVAGHEQVDVVRRAAAQVLGEILAREVGGRPRRQLVAVAHLVQCQILGDVFGELDGITRLANGGHQQVVGDLVDFVLVCGMANVKNVGRSARL